MDIDAAFAEAQAPVDAQVLPDANIEATEEPTTEEVPEAEAEAPLSAEEQAARERKKLENAIDKRDKKIYKMQGRYEAELKALREQVQQVMPKAAPQNTGEPKEADFTNYHDYIRALTKYDNEKTYAERESKQQETQKATKQQAWESERLAAVDKQSEEFAKEHPEVTALFDEYADVIKEYPPEIKRLFLEADNAPLAFLNLAKEGKIESLGEMSLAKAAMEIGRAQTQAAIKPKTKAPAPLPASRGAVAGSKSLNDMNPDELLNWVRSPT